MPRKRVVKKKTITKKATRRKRVERKAPKTLDTQKQKKLTKLITENLGKSGSTKTMYAMMIEAGYSEGSAKQQSAILSTIKEKPEVKNAVDKMVEVRDKFLAELARKDPTKIDAAAVARIMKDLNHDIELLSGRPTENLGGELSLDPESKASIDAILAANKK